MLSSSIALRLRVTPRLLFAIAGAFGACSLPMLSVHAEPFIGQFELKTLESAPGSFEFQSQNAWAWDQPARRIDTDTGDEPLLDENALFRERYALELEIGLTHSLKMRVGIEGENERVDDPEDLAQANDFEGLSVGEIGAEIVAILAQREGDGFGIGVVAEVEGPFDQEEPNHLTLGPIMEYQSGRWLLAAVPMLVRSFGGDREENESRDEKWDFAYAAQLMHTFSDRWKLALEGYGTVERIGSTGTRSEAAERFGDSNQHRLGPVLYFSHEFGTHNDRSARSESSIASGEEESEGTTLTIGLGLLEGLTSDTADHTLKLSIEADF